MRRGTFSETENQMSPLGVAAAQTFEQVPPQSLEAEQCALGSILVEPETIPIATELIDLEDFYRKEHQKVYEAVLRLYERGKAVDVITVCDELKATGDLEEVGGAVYVTTLISMVPSAANIATYCHIIRQKALLRRLINAAFQIGRLGYDESTDARETVNKAEQIIFSVSQNVLRGDFVPVSDIARETYKKVETRYEHRQMVTGVETGLTALDSITGGLQPSDLIIIAGRPSMGKTSLAFNVAYHAAVNGKIPVAMFSLEMAREQLVEGIISASAGVDGQRLRTGNLNQEEWERISYIIQKLYNIPIFIDDTPGNTALDIRAKARRLTAKHNVGLAIVDYLQLIPYHGRAENRNQELSFISRALKETARELRVPVVALSQLSRGVERERRRPILSDLRDSGAIEAEADVVAFLYRADEEGQEEVEGKFPPSIKLEIIIAKHRNGPTGSAEVMFHRRQRRFADVERVRAEVPEQKQIDDFHFPRA